MIDQVREHLRLLSIFHYIVGGIGYLVSLFPIIHLVFGIFVLVSSEELDHPRITASSPSDASVEAVEVPPRHELAPKPDEVFPARWFGLMFIVIPALMILCGFTLSTFVIVAGKRLASQRSHTFCLVIAGIECLIVPFGTVLGVFTILTLIRPEARQLFGLPPLSKDGTAAPLL